MENRKAPFEVQMTLEVTHHQLVAEQRRAVIRDLVHALRALDVRHDLTQREATQRLQQVGHFRNV